MRLRPFLKVTWYGNTLIKKGLIYIAGLTTHGIDNSIHRGSITVWCAVTMQTFEKRLRPSTQDIQNNLDKTCSHFKYGVSNPSFCPKFYEAFQINVEDYTSLREISNALDELTKESRNPEYTESINNLTILINKVKKFLTGACT